MNSPRKSPGGNRGNARKQNLSPNSTHFKIEFNENPRPSNLEAETKLIENLLFRPKKTALAKNIVRPEDFYSTLRGNVYKRILKFHESGRVWNWTTLRDSFQADSSFPKYEDFFDDLLPFTSEVVSHNARIIRDCANQRRLIAAIYQANLGLFNGEGLEPVRAILERVLAEVSSVSA